MSVCECCRFRSDISQKYDPTCARDYTQGFPAELHDDYETTGDLSLSVVNGFIVADSGSGSFRYLRLPHENITDNGARVQAEFHINGTTTDAVARPTSGKQRVFGWDWCVELDWSDETLRAFTCDSEGVPTSAAWYEQVVTEFFDARYWHNQSTKFLRVIIHMGEVDGQVKRIISAGAFSTLPVATKDFDDMVNEFWYGLSADHNGDDLTFGDGGLTCSHGIQTPADVNSWWCPQMPLIIAADLTDAHLDEWTNKDDHFPDSTILIPAEASSSWFYTTEEVDEGGITYFPRARVGPSVVGTDWGIRGNFEEGRSSGGTLLSSTYWLQGTSNSPKDPKPPAWDCDETSNRSLPVEISSSDFDDEPTTYDYSPVGLTTPASPP